jgi:hypothetical protein
VRLGRSASEEEVRLGGSAYLGFGAAAEGEFVPLFAHEYSSPRAPVLFGTENDQLLSAPFTRKDDLLLWKTLHLYVLPFASLWSVAFVVVSFGEPLGYAEGNFAHLRDGHKMNGALLQSTYAVCEFDSLL